MLRQVPIMTKIVKFVAVVFIVFASQLAAYFVFLEDHISSWGARGQETSIQMAGDHITPHITSTRAINISAPKAEVWRWLMQLGADRGGFYSYYFIEKALGYSSRTTEYVDTSFDDFKVGDVVRGSLDDSESIVPYNFTVLFIKSEESLVLDKWGTFKVVSLGVGKSRLIVRSHSQARASASSRIIDRFLGTPLHFIMERRTLMGIKDRAEKGPGPKFSTTRDAFWFAGVILSLIVLLVLAFLSRSTFHVVLLIAITTLWTISLFALKPVPIYSISIAFLALSGLVYTFRTRQRSTND